MGNFEVAVAGDGFCREQRELFMAFDRLGSSRSAGLVRRLRSLVRFHRCLTSVFDALSWQWKNGTARRWFFDGGGDRRRGRRPPKTASLALCTEQLEVRALLSASPAIDPTVAIPLSVVANRGQAVNLPVSITDDANGLLSADLNFTYAPGSLSVANSDVALSDFLQGEGWTLTTNADPSSGLIRTSAFSPDGPLPSGAAQLLNIQFHVGASAGAGVYPVHIVTTATVVGGASVPASRLNEGQLALSAVDGSLRVPIDAVIMAPASETEGSPVSLTGSMLDAFDDPNPVRYSWVITDSSNHVVASDTNDPSPNFAFTPGDDGAYSVTLTIADAADPTDIFGSANVSIPVSEPAITAVPSSLPAVSEGAASGTVTVATFSHASGVESAGEFTASVDWGFDGHHSDPATVTQPGGAGTGYVVTAVRPVYAEQNVYSAVVSISEDNVAATVTDMQTVDAVPATLATIQEGDASAIVTVATFDHDQGTQSTSGMSATVDWGIAGHHADAASVTQPSGSGTGYVVTASRPVYAEEGTYPVVVSVSEADATTSANDVLTVTEAPLLSSRAALPVISEGDAPAIVEMGTFTHANGVEPPTDFTALVNWEVAGHTSDTATVTQDAQGAYHITSLRPVFAEESGGYTISVLVFEDNASTIIPDTQTVLEPPINGVSTPLSAAVEGQAASAGVEVATFTHAANVEPAGDFSATIDWHDGQGPIAANAITQDVSGVYHVAGTRPVYAEEGTYTVTIVVSDNESPAATQTITNSLTVNEPQIDAAATALAPIVEGQASADVEIATFTHASAIEPAGHFSATVDWGQGPVAADAVTEDGSSVYHVTASRPVFAEEGTYPVTLVISDNDNLAMTQQVDNSLTVNDAPLSITSLTPPNAAEGIPTGTITVATFSDAAGASSEIEDLSAMISWGDGVTEPGSIVATATPGVYQVHGSHTYPTEVTGLTFAVSISDSDGGAADSQTAMINVAHTTFRVNSFAPNTSGFDVTFNRAADLSVLNLYSGENTGPLTPDLALVGENVGAVSGSLLWNASTNTATFVKTGGPLAADTYHVTLDSRTDGFRDARAGELLDGNANGTVSDDYSNSFTIADYSNARVVSLPDVARGPGQSIDFSQMPLGATGLPIRISDGSGVTSVGLELGYDPALLTIGAVSPTAATAGWSINTSASSTGHLVIQATGPALGGGQQNLFSISATVASTALYGAAQELRLSSVSLNGGDIAAVGDRAMDKVTFIGDATGDQTYSALDASLVARNVVGLDTGFDQYLLTDPRVVADVTGDGTLSGLDAYYIARAAVDPDHTPIVPTLPAGYVPQASGGIDPLVTVPISHGNPGKTVNVPISVSDVNGLQGVDLAFNYDSSVVNIANADIALAGTFAANGWSITKNLTTPGLIRLSMYGTEPLASSGSDTILNLAFHVPTSTASGEYPVSVVTSPIVPATTSPSRLNEGELTLSTDNGAIVISDPLTVENTNDDGAGSLRQVIEYANTLPGSPLTITFAIPAGPQAIQLLSPLPASNVPLVVQLDPSQNVSVLSPAGGGENNFSALTKIGAGSLTIAGANNLTGNVEVSDGRLAFDASAPPTLVFGLTTTVDGTGTLELDSSIPALAGGAGGSAIVNNSSAAAGVFVGGTNQLAAGIDGTGNLVIGDAGDLTANHVVQGALVIGGSAGHPATLTIAASDASGNPLAVGQAFQPDSATSGAVRMATVAFSTASANVAVGQAAPAQSAVSIASPVGDSVRLASPTASSHVVSAKSSSTIATSDFASIANGGPSWSILTTAEVAPQSSAALASVGDEVIATSGLARSLDPNAVAAAFGDGDILDWIGSSRRSALWDEASTDAAGDAIGATSPLLSDAALEAISRGWQV